MLSESVLPYLYGKDRERTRKEHLSTFHAFLAYYKKVGKGEKYMDNIVNSTLQTPIEIALGIDEYGMTTARKLYEFLELTPGNYARWCKSNITENDFAEEGIDYYSSSMKSEGKGNFAEDFKLTAHFAEKLSCKGNGERAEQAREYFSTLDDKVKEVAINRQQLSPQMQMLMAMVESQARQELEQKRQAEQISRLTDGMKQLEARMTTHNENYFTIAGYASLRGMNVDISRANMLGRKASQISRKYGYEIGKAQDVRFGAVNTYHVDILKSVFDRKEI